METRRILGASLAILIILIVIGIIILSLFSKPVYKVTFDYDNDTIEKVVEVKAKDKVKEIKGIKKEGYTFLGWYLNDVKYDFKSPVTQDITLYAKWEEIPKKTYTVIFDSDGGTRTENITIEENEIISEIPNPTKKGYSFKGWYYKNKEFNFNTKITQDITLKAKWKKDKK